MSGIHRIIVLLLSAAVIFVVTGCDDDDRAMVTITGTVLNIEIDGAVAVGVRVSLLDTDFQTTVPTGDDGAFTLKIPKGSVFYLRTDDFDPASTDAWFPLINIDTPALLAETNMQGVVIHACPQTVGQAAGSVAVWDRFLGEEDGANGDRFAPTLSSDNAGVVSMLIQSCNGLAQVPTDSLFVEFGDPAFPTAYFRSEALFGGGLAADISPRAYSMTRGTDTGGWIMSFGDAAYSGATLTATITDPKVGRGWSFAPVEFPVRPGVISLVVVVVLDSETGHSLQDLLPCLMANQ